VSFQWTTRGWAIKGHSDDARVRGRHATPATPREPSWCSGAGGRDGGQEGEDVPPRRPHAGERTLNGRKEIVVCGFVSGKAPSGSSGDQAFIARIYPDSASSFELVAMGGASETRRLVDSTCRAAGLPISDSA
jgi:hypothetical protein